MMYLRSLAVFTSLMKESSSRGTMRWMSTETRRMRMSSPMKWPNSLEGEISPRPLNLVTSAALPRRALISRSRSASLKQ